ncbi:MULTISPECIES: hypothetical protein [unclassified Streptomyces]|uniref:hypothetical protein n=1 Tax=unclassified Streptomyces TaxID=2593676 RepID=UPI0008801060|nr:MULTISPECIES: hypothetical protein [unclassified Streptomyces]SDR62076.1 hypothetical protein SAMN05216511_7268 [Streptomyces sp. KS_16]
MPLHRNDQRTKANIQAAADALRAAGEPEYADTVDGLLTPSGAAFIKRLYAERVPTPMNVYMPEVERDHVRKAAEEAGDNVSALGDQGLYEFIHGKFRPGPYARAAARVTSAGDERTLSLTVDKRLKDEATNLIKNPDFVRELGWKPRGAAMVVRLFLQQQYPMFGDVDPAEVYKAHEAGASVEEITERFGLNQGAVELLVEPRQGLSPVDEAEIVRRYDADPQAIVPWALSQEFGVHYVTVTRLLNRLSSKRGKDSPSS